MTRCLDNVARRDTIDREALWTDHLRTQVPLVLTGLFDDQPVAELRTLERARARLGELRFTIRPEYTGSLLIELEHGPVRGAKARPMRFSEYWEMVERAPDTSLMSTEEALGEALGGLLTTPALFSRPDGSADDDLTSAVFIGNAGNHASMHFDGDGRHVALTQLFGRKRVVVVPVERARALRPLVNFATLALQACDADHKLRLLEALGAWDTILEPGDTIVMPALVYHYVEYLDHGMSVNFRFGRSPLHRFVSQHLHLDEAMQALASRWLRADDAVERTWQRLLDAYAEPAPAPWRHYRRMRRTALGLLEELNDPSLAVVPLDPALAPPYVALPPVAHAAILRMHLFNERLYRHREAVPRAALPRL